MSRVAHMARADHRAERPVHVTMRVRCRCLRTQAVFPAVRAVLGAVNRRRPDAFRVVEFSVQSNHIHLIVEADSRTELVSGMRSLAIRLALNVNRALKRRGSLLDGRWHGHELTTPREVRHALVYVLANGAKHGVHGHTRDAFSSAPYFRGFSDVVTPPGGEPPNVAAKTWLLRIGWQKWGLIAISERPKS